MNAFIVTCIHYLYYYSNEINTINMAGLYEPKKIMAWDAGTKGQ
jgi:hypothetical protein